MKTRSSTSRATGKTRRPERTARATQLPRGITLRAEQLVKRYKKRTVVKSIAIEVSQNEIVGLLGPNGAGKTTTFYMIVGMIRPNEGRVYFDSRDINFDSQIFANDDYCHLKTIENFNESKIFNFNSYCSLLCINIRSIKKHFTELQTFLHSCHHTFTFIVICETWLNTDFDTMFERSLPCYHPSLCL